MQEEQNNVSRRTRGPKKSRGGKNLALLGLAATLIALLTTSISLIIYHNSGDIYLDRSRPGFLPDEEEVKKEEAEEESEYDFAKEQKITTETLNRYLENVEVEIKAIDSYSKPFNAEALSDSRLGIPANEE